MNKLTAIKIKYDDGTYSDEIPISVLSKNVEWDSTHTLVDVLGSIDVGVTGTIQDQISQLFNEKVSNSDMQNYITSSVPTYITNWLNTNVNPVGSAVIVDSSLTVSGAAADAKKTGDEISELKSDIREIADIKRNYFDYTLAQSNKFINGQVGQQYTIRDAKNRFCYVMPAVYGKHYVLQRTAYAWFEVDENGVILSRKGDSTGVDYLEIIVKNPNTKYVCFSWDMV